VISFLRINSLKPMAPYPTNSSILLISTCEGIFYLLGEEIYLGLVESMTLSAIGIAVLSYEG